MGYLEDFWANINNPKIATAPDPVMNITKVPSGFITADSWNWGSTPTTTVTTPPTAPANTGGNAPANTQSFESLYPKQTQQMIKMGVDTTKLGEIVTRQDEEDIILHEKHKDQETRISANADAIATHGHDYSGIDHTHANGEKACEWWDLQCQFSKGMEGLGKLALLGVIAFFAFMIIKKRLKI